MIKPYHSNEDDAPIAPTDREWFQELRNRPSVRRTNEQLYVHDDGEVEVEASWA